MTKVIGLTQIQVAEAVIARIGFSNLEEGQEPGQQFPVWLTQEGIDFEQLAQAAALSAKGSTDELMQMIEDGHEVGEKEIRDAMADMFVTTFLTGWLCLKRKIAPPAE